MSSGIDELIEALINSMELEDGETTEDLYLDREYTLSCAADAVNKLKAKNDSARDKLEEYKKGLLALSRAYSDWSMSVSDEDEALIDALLVEAEQRDG